MVTDTRELRSVPASAEAPPEGVPLAIEQEMRFAIVMYGGVSLAIYINGVAQELLRLVRATAPSQPTSDAPRSALLGAHALKGTEKVYRKLGQLVRREAAGLRSATADEGPEADDPIRTRFVVDVISGSSAGGINGIFLAKALALASKDGIDPLRALWVDEGDIGLLVNDPKSYDDLPGLSPGAPASVLNSRRLYWLALAALDRMKAEGSETRGVARSCLVDELDLWVTTTDIRGLVLPINLFDRIVYEKRHRHVLHFVYGSDHGTGAERNDFLSTFDPMLAFAARATSAFPFAFEPMTLDDIDEPLRTDHFSAYRGRGARCEDWKGYFRDYVDARRPVLAGEQRSEADTYRSESFGDGGYLDNKPFSWATKTLGHRRADLPVDRRLIYIEPDPSGPPARLERAEVGGRHVDVPAAWSPPREKVDPLANVLAALTGLPRSEAIRDDLEQLIARNREIARIRDLTTIVDRSASANGSDPETSSAWFRPIPTDEWLRTSARQLYRMRGPQYAAYHRLKVNAVLDDIAEYASVLTGLDSTSDFSSGMRCLVQAWFENRYSEDAAGPDALTQTRFLFDFDVRFRLRRLRYLNQRCEELLRLDEEALRFYTECRQPVASTAPVLEDRERAEYEFVLREAKVWLNELHVRLRWFVRSLRAPTRNNPLLEALQPLRGLVGGPDLLGLVSGSQAKDEWARRAGDLIERKPAVAAALDDLADAVAETFGDALRANSQLVRQLTSGELPDLLDTVTARGVQAERAAFILQPLAHVCLNYELYDSVRFPFTYGIADEENLVEIIRVSPQDARSLIDETGPGDGTRRGDEPNPGKTRRKLAGVELHHFGGFFERHWRKNDLIWGRLDAAERLIETILPPSDLRTELLEEAQREIIKEEFETETNAPIRAELVDQLLRHSTAKQTVPGAPAPPSRRRLDEAVNSVNDPETIRCYLRDDYEVDRTLDRQRFMHTVSRASTVTGQVLDGMSSRYGAMKTPARWMTRAGRFSFYAVEAATPRSIASLLARYWIGLLLVTALILIVGGPLVGSSAAAKTGWFLLLALGVTQALLWLLDDIFKRRVRLVYVALASAVVLVVGLAAAEVVAHRDDDAGYLVEKLPQPVEDFLRWLWPWDDDG